LKIDKWGKRMISKNVICEVKKKNFYRAIDKINFGVFPSVYYYSFSIYFRYKSFIKCTDNQEERDRAYLDFNKVRGNMWVGIIAIIFPISLLVSIFLISSVS
jgi:hypothetical protein